VQVAAAHPLGIRDSRARTLAVAFIFALVAHLPLTPFPFVLRWLAAYLSRSDTSWDYQDDRVIIPISLVDDVPPSEPPPEPTAAGAAEPQARPRDRGDDRARDAGAPDSNTADVVERDGARDGGRRWDGGPPPAEPLAAGDAGGDGDGGAGPSVKDTLSLVGGLRRAVKGKPNVALVLWFSTMREHPLGPLVGSLLACNEQWRDFLADQVDPLRDLDGVMLVGPRMADTSKVTALVQHRMDDTKLQNVISFVGHRAERTSTGGFIPGPAGTRAVRFHADRADRIAFTHPRNLIIVTPPDGFEQLRELREPISLPPGRGRAMSLTMVTPWRPLRNVGARLPETLSEMRVDLFAASDGGVNVEIEFDDQDAASAESHAREISDQARAMGGPLLSDIEFVAQGNHLAAQTHLSRITSAIALGFVRGSICPAGALDGGRGVR